MGTYVENLGKGGGNKRVSGLFFKAVVYAVLIFWAKTWVMTPHMGQALVGLQQRVDQRITGRHPQRLLGGSWEYPPLDKAIQEAGFE